MNQIKIGEFLKELRIYYPLKSTGHKASNALFYLMGHLMSHNIIN